MTDITGYQKDWKEHRPHRDREADHNRRCDAVAREVYSYVDRTILSCAEGPGITNEPHVKRTVIASISLILRNNFKAGLK